MKRAEIRAHTRSLPLPERLKFVEGLDDTQVLAILDAPAMLSGLPDDRYSHVKRAYFEKQFGARMKELESIEDDFIGVESAQQMVRRDLQIASGLSDNDFATLERSHEQ